MSRELPMNVYKKLQEVRVALQTLPMTKSGHNKFAGYKYFELADFMPNVNRLFDEHKLCSIVSFDNHDACLRIVNSENPEDCVHFNSPMSTAQLKGCHEVQNLGAVQTYLRRYLYMLALEIVDQDPLDAKTGDSETVVHPSDKPKPTTGDTAVINPKCPKCGNEKSVIAGKPEYGGGWVCFTKKAGGCGHKWQDAVVVVVTEFATKEQLEEIEILAPKVGIGIMKILEKYKVGTLSMLTKEQADAALHKLVDLIAAKEEKEKANEAKDIP